MIRHLLLLLALLALAGCEASFSTANISQAEMAKGFESGAAVDPTSTFEPTDTFHAVVTVSNAPDGTKLRFVWFYGDQRLDATDFTVEDGKNVVNATLTNDNEWPAGDYTVEIYLNDKLDRTLSFSVAGEPASGNSDGSSNDRGGGSGEVSLDDAALSLDFAEGQPVDITDTFATTTNPIHLSVLLNGETEGVEVAAVWVAVDAGGEQDATIYEDAIVLSADEQVAHFTLEYNGEWPTGTYQAQVFINGEFATALDYTIE